MQSPKEMGACMDPLACLPLPCPGASAPLDYISRVTPGLPTGFICVSLKKAHGEVKRWSPCLAGALQQEVLLRKKKMCFFCNMILVLRIHRILFCFGFL